MKKVYTITVGKRALDKVTKRALRFIAISHIVVKTWTMVINDIINYVKSAKKEPTKMKTTIRFNLGRIIKRTYTVTPKRDAIDKIRKKRLRVAAILGIFLKIWEKIGYEIIDLLAKGKKDLKRMEIILEIR